MTDTVNVEIGSDLVRPIIESKIQAAIHEALGRNPTELIQAIVHQALHVKVDAMGVVRKESYYNKHDYLEAMVKKAIREEAEKAVVEVIDQHRDKIRDSVKKEIAGHRGSSKIAKAVVEGISESLKCKYTSSLVVKFASNEEK